MPALLVHVSVAETAPTIVTVAGEIDIASVVSFRCHLLALPDASTIVELSNVRLLSATGLNELVCLRDRLARAGASLALVAAPRVVRRILAATQIANTVLLTDTIDEATHLITARSRQPPSPACRSA